MKVIELSEIFPFSVDETTDIRQKEMLVNILEVHLQTFVQVKEDEESRSSAAEPRPAELDPVSF